MRWLVRLGLLLATLLGCESGVTEVVLRTRVIGFELPAEVDAIAYRIEGPAGDPRLDRVVSLAELPPERRGDFSFSIVHADGLPFTGYTVTAEALHEGAAVEPAVVSSRVIDFVSGRTERYTLVLDRACAEVRCAPGEECAAGECVDPARDAGVARDGAAPPDLGACMDGCSCSETCADRKCECKEGCECDFACPTGDDCEELECDDASCSVDARDASNVGLHCNESTCRVEAEDSSNVTVRCDRACCLIDCRGVSNCEVECRRESYCRVDCAGASSCRFDECWHEEGAQDCGDGTILCGRQSCPGPADRCFEPTFDD